MDYPQPRPALIKAEPIFREIPTATPVFLGDLVNLEVFALCALLNGNEGSDEDGISPQPLTIDLFFAEMPNPPVTLPTKRLPRSKSPGRPRQTTPDLTPLLYNPQRLQMDRRMRRVEQNILPASTLPQPAPSYPHILVAVGEQEQFWVIPSASSDDFVQVTATCRKVGVYCYIFVDNSVSPEQVTEAFINSLADFFDQRVYPLLTRVFGPTTDTDNDPRIYILLTPLSGMGGYFYSIDKFPASTGPEFSHSNEHDIFYLAAPDDSSPEDLAFLEYTLAHEFQHMINFDRHRANNAPSERTWLNESLSELAGFLATGEIRSRYALLNNFFADPSVGLTVWIYRNPTATLKNYAAANLFGIYLYDRFVLDGPDPDLIQRLVNNTQVGIRNVTEVTGIDFNTLFKDWVFAMLISNTPISTNPIYQYRSIQLRTDGLRGLSYTDLVMGTSYVRQVYPYTPMVVRILNINEQSYIRLIGDEAQGRLMATPMGEFIIQKRNRQTA